MVRCLGDVARVESGGDLRVGHPAGHAVVQLQYVVDAHLRLARRVSIAFDREHSPVLLEGLQGLRIGLCVQVAQQEYRLVALAVPFGKDAVDILSFAHLGLGLQVEVGRGYNAVVEFDYRHGARFAARRQGDGVVVADAIAAHHPDTVRATPVGHGGGIGIVPPHEAGQTVYLEDAARAGGAAVELLQGHGVGIELQHHPGYRGVAARGVFGECPHVVADEPYCVRGFGVECGGMRFTGVRFVLLLGLALQWENKQEGQQEGETYGCCFHGCTGRGLIVRHVGDGRGAEYGGVGGVLGNGGLLLGNSVGAIGDANRRFAEEGLEPGTGSRVAAILQVQVVAVAAEGVAQAAAAGILYGGAGGDNDGYVLTLGHLVVGEYHVVVHGLLVLTIAEESRVCRVLGVGPGLLQGILYVGVGRMGTNVVHEFGQVGEVGAVLPGQGAHLLEYDVVPLLVF